MANAKLPFGYCNNETIQLRARLETAKCDLQSTDIGNTAAYYLLLFGIILMGIGRSMPHTLGVPLIDDSVKNKRNTPVYFAAISCLRIFGPVFGMVLSAVCSGLYVNFKPPPGMTPYDARWIGAWWLGFIVVTGTLVAPSLGLILYPNVDTIIKDRQEAYRKKKQLAIENGDKKSSENALLDESTENQASRTRKESVTKAVKNARGCVQVLAFVGAIVEILKSPIYTGRLIGRMFDAFAWKGMGAFRSKFLENHFGIPMYKVRKVYFRIRGYYHVL